MRASFFVVAFAAALCPTILSPQTTLTLGTTSLTFGPGDGAGSIVIGATGPWTASTTTPWLHISPDSQSGSTSGVFAFTFDANRGPTRTGSIAFSDGHALTITQAGQNYFQANEVTTLVSSNLTSPVVDAAGNVYFVDVLANAVRKWTKKTGEVTTPVLIGLSTPSAIALDSTGDIYIADTGHNALKEWVAATGQLVILASSLNQPGAVAIDGLGNVYIADTGNNAIEEWTPSSGQIITLVSGLNHPEGVTTDAAGNVYFSDTNNQAIKEWVAATGQTSTLMSSGLTAPSSVVWNTATNSLYISDGGSLVEWHAPTGKTTSIRDCGRGFCVTAFTLDPAGNFYIVWATPDECCFTGKAVAGPLPIPEFSADNQIYFGPSFMQGIAVDFAGNVYFTSTDGSLLGGAVQKWAPGGRLSRIVPGFLFPPFAGIAVDTAGSLYLVGWNGDLSEWITATEQTVFLSHVLGAGKNGVYTGGPAVDRDGNVYFTDAGALKEWVATTRQLKTLVSGLPALPNGAQSVAVDVAANVYFSVCDQPSTCAYEEWMPAAGTVSILNPSALFEATDTLGNRYFNSFPNTVNKRTSAFIDPAPLVEPLSAGSDQLPPVLPSATPLDAVSDQPWLTITSQDNGIVRFSFTATTSPRTAHISLLGQTIYVTQTDTSVPTVVSYSALGGPQSYNLSDSTRNRLPWQITGIRVVFSKAITSADVTSLNGAAGTALTGLGANALTWTIQPVSSGSYTLSLSNSGSNAITDSSGNPLVGDSTQKLNVLWGDVNDDGVVNAADLALISSEFHPTISNPNPTYDIFADVNGDGVVDAADIQIVRTQIGQTLP